MATFNIDEAVNGGKKTFSIAEAYGNSPQNSPVTDNSANKNIISNDPPNWIERQLAKLPNSWANPDAKGTVLGSIVKGMADPSVGLAQTITNLLPDSTGIPQSVNNWVASQEPNYEQARSANGRTGFDAARLVGNIASPVNLLTARILPSTQGMGALKTIATGASVGGLGAMTQPVQDAVGDNNTFWGNKAKQATIGAALGGVITPIAGAISNVISPNTSSDVTNLMSEGVTPTPGQILGGGWKATEDKLTSVPVVGGMIKNAQRRAIDDFNTATYNRALNPIGQQFTGTPGREGIEQVKNTLGAAYDALLPKLTFNADPQFTGELQKIGSMASSLPTQQAAQFNKILANTLFNKLGPQGTMDGIALKGVESDLAKFAKGYSGDSSFDNRQLGNALGEVLSSIRGSLVRSNPEQAAQLQAINQGYANYARIRGAAASLGASNGVFTPAQLQNAVKTADKSVGKGSFATGNAFLQDLSEAGKNVLGNTYPDSGTVGRGLLVSAGPAAVAAYANPAAGLLGAGTAGAAMLPYTQTGQKLMASLLTSRPAGAKELSGALRNYAPLLAPNLSNPIYNLFNARPVASQ